MDQVWRERKWKGIGGKRVKFGSLFGMLFKTDSKHGWSFVSTSFWMILTWIAFLEMNTEYSILSCINHMGYLDAVLSV